MVKKVTNAKILIQFLNNYGRKYYLREIADLLKTSHQAIKPYLENLVSKKVLVKIKIKNLVEYSLNFENKQIYSYLSIAESENLNNILNKEIILKLLFEKLSNFFTKNTFIIFGSSVEKAKKGSDIDLLIVGKSNAMKVIFNFEEIYNKKIHKVQIDNLNKLNKTLIKEIYKKHIIFNNTEQIVRFFGNLYEQNKLV